MPITLACIAILLVSYIDVHSSILLSTILGFALIWRAHPDSIVGLLILYSNKYDFYDIIDYKVMGRYFTVEQESLLIAGFPINLPTLASMFVTFRIIDEFIRSPKTFKNISLRTLLIIWLFTLIPATFLFFYSYSIHHVNWTRGFRFLLTSGSFFYGIILYKKWSEYGDRRFQKHFVSLSIAVLFFLNINFFWSHLVFLIIAFASALSYYMIRQPNLQYKIIGLGMIACTFNIIFNATITILLIGLISYFLAFMSYGNIFNKNSKEKVGVKYFGYILIISSLIFSFAIVLISKSMSIEYIGISSSINENLLNRVFAKMFYDRFILWDASFNQILNGPFFIVPSGRPLILEGLMETTEWMNGSHNIVLEVYRNSGLFIGSVTLVIIIYAVRVNLMILVKSKDNLLKCMSSAVIASVVTGMSVGDFTLDISVGIFIWCLAGLFYAKEFSLLRE